MRILFFVLGTIVGMAAIGTRAEAQNYPWCAEFSGPGGTNCGFTSFQQCMGYLQGIGGFCNQNTQYQPTVGPPAGYRLRHKSHTHY